MRVKICFQFTIAHFGPYVCGLRPAILKMDVENLRQSSQLRLLTLLTKIAPKNVPKDLVIHEDLMKPIDQVAGARLLRYKMSNFTLSIYTLNNYLFYREQGVDKMFKFVSTIPQWKNSTRVYLIPSIYAVAENIANSLLRKEGLEDVAYHVIVVPKLMNLIQSLFESFGQLDYVTLHSYSWDFIPLDLNLLSLEMPHFFNASFLKGENSLLSSIAKALMSLECLVGKFPCVTTLGEKSRKVHTLLGTWKSEIQAPVPDSSEFSHLVMLDRNMDFVSLLLTQLTYEGVLDENMNMKSGFVYLNNEGAEGSQRLMLNSTSDEIYAEVSLNILFCYNI